MWSMSDRESAATLLRELRRREGQSLRSAAAEIGIAPSQLSRMETGQRGVGDDAVSRLSAYYQVPAEIIELARGDAPADVIRILQQHPEEIDRLRKMYPA